MGMTFPKVALPETYISASWRTQWNIALPCFVYVPQRKMLAQTQGHTAVQTLQLPDRSWLLSNHLQVWADYVFVCLQLTV